MSIENMNHLLRCWIGHLNKALVVLHRGNNIYYNPKGTKNLILNGRVHVRKQITWIELITLNWLIPDNTVNRGLMQHLVFLHFWGALKGHKHTGITSSLIQYMQLFPSDGWNTHKVVTVALLQTETHTETWSDVDGYKVL